MNNTLCLFGLFVLGAMWCWYQSVRCREMAEREYDSYQQGMLHKYSTRFFVAGIAILAMGFLITGLYIAS